MQAEQQPALNSSALNARPVGNSTSSRVHRFRGGIVNVVLFLFTVVLAAGFMFPFFWAISSSLKGPFEILAYPPTLLPKEPIWHNYVDAWNSADLGLYFSNSLIVTSLSLIGQVASSFIVAYGFARFRFP